MKTTSAGDTARLGVMLNELRLPTIKLVWPQFAEQADKEGWQAARFLAAIAEHELAERDRRRVERHLAEARLPPRDPSPASQPSRTGRSSCCSSATPLRTTMTMSTQSTSVATVNANRNMSAETRGVHHLQTVT